MGGRLLARPQLAHVELKMPAEQTSGLKDRESRTVRAASSSEFRMEGNESVPGLYCGTFHVTLYDIPIFTLQITTLRPCRD